LLLYVDDIILIACNDALLRQLTDRLCAEFAIKDLGPLHYFISLEVVHRADGFFVHQRKYAQDILEHVGMLNYSPAATPVDMNAKLSATTGSPATDAPHYRSIVGGLQYLTLTRPELQYAVQ
jgi:histone deacetylase 1/2